MMNLPVIKQIAQTTMADKRSSPYYEQGDKYAHGERVAALAVLLRQLILPDENGRDEILTVAAWFHDICNGEVDHTLHAALGVNRTKELLAAYCTTEELEQICAIIAVHDDRKPTGKEYPNAVKIHQDADHLDHFGSLSIWRTATYTMGRNETIYDALDYLQNRWPDDIERWRGELHFDFSKRIFDDRIAFKRSFIERFAVEGVGGIWNEDVIKNNA
jgi:uncharacterized protein